MPTETLSIGPEYFSGDLGFLANVYTDPGTIPRSITDVTVFVKDPIMTPATISYAAKVHPRLRTERPFTVQFSREGQNFAACVEDLDEYGLGASRSEALDDLGRTLAELYFSLRRDAGRLSGDLQSVWNKLQSHLSSLDAYEGS